MPDSGCASLRSLGGWRRSIVVGGFGGAFLLAVANAAVRPLWFDELLTFYVSRLGDPIEIWNALEQTADGQPPLSYLLTALSHTVLGESEFATRWPSLLAFLVASYAWYLWTAERIGALYGVIASGFLWATLLFNYSYEARPYTLMTACVALSFLFWRRACSGRRRRGGLLGLSLTAALAIASHYYAVFALFAVGAGELARTWRRRKFDIPVWAALASGAATMLFYLPLIEGAREVYSRGFWSLAQSHDLLYFYFICLYPAALSLLAIPYLITLAWKPQKITPAAERRAGFPVEECVAMWVLAASPALTVAAVMWTTKAYVFRYSFPAALALAWIYTVTVHGLHVGLRAKRRERTPWIVLGLLAACFINRAVTNAGHLATEYEEGFRTRRTFAALEELNPAPRLPIAVTSPLAYFVFCHYAPERWRSRLVYVSDAERCLRVANENTPDVILSRFTQWAPLRVEQRQEYLSRGQDFLLLETLIPYDRDWLSLCGKFDAKNLVRLHETKDFVLYRWNGSPKAGTGEEPRRKANGSLLQDPF